MSKDIRISEIFGPTIQGEGSLIGQPTVFVRTGGCDYRCSWCDTLFAVDSAYRDQWQPMSVEAVFAEVCRLSNYSPLLITLSGGNPATQPLAALIELAKENGYAIAMETQGSVSQKWFNQLDHLVLSPKPPSSGMDTDLNVLKQCIDDAGDKPELTLKVVIFDEDDFHYAKNISKQFPVLPMVLQTGNLQTDQNIEFDQLITSTKQLVDLTIRHQWYNVKVLPQLHTLLWGNERGR